VYKEVEQQEKEVLLFDNSTPALVAHPTHGMEGAATGDTGQAGATTVVPAEPSHTVVRVVTKPVIELLCCNHNPVRNVLRASSTS
jgi:hypothetical protein